MKIYVLADKKTYDAIKFKINQAFSGEIFHFEEKDISKIAQLFSDSEEKVLAIEPTLLNWSLPNEAISRISNLRGICTSSAWARFIDFDYCKEHAISITKTIGANSQSVAEYGIWMMYCLARRLPMHLQKNDESNYHTELYGKTLGIIGLGNIGLRIAEIGNGIGMRVQYWNRSQKESSYTSVTWNI
jgi:lactate dehydrogenase-like 2-hydroxyacid dehydrogenase